MRNKKVHIFILFILGAVIGASLYFAYPFMDSIDLGLDLRGGTQIVLKPTQEDIDEVTEESIEQAMFIIRERIDALGVSEPLITRDYTNNIVIQLPGVKDPDRAMEVIGRTAQLEFRILESIDPQTGEAELGPVLMTGDKLASAQAGYDPTGRIVVTMNFTSEGQQEFAEITAQNVGEQLAIVLDGEIQSAPVIRQAITGDAVIEGIGSLADANDVALVLRTGALPVDLSIEENITVGPTLGRDALTGGLYAGAIGLILIAAFMVVYYRGLGLISVINLLLYIIIFWGVLASLGAALTLPGIAGIILTIGMAVDANVIIFERIKEEIHKEKTARTSISQGFKHGLRTIVDSNITTLITAGALYRFGTGPVRGFAVTLAIGVVISMLTSLVFSRTIIYMLAGFRRVATPQFLGVWKRRGLS